jgi:hypothetical protein
MFDSHLDLGGERPADGVPCAAHLDRHRPVERRLLQDRDLLGRHQTERRQVAQQLGVAVGDASHDRHAAGLEIAQTHHLVALQQQLRRRDRVAVRIARGEAQRAVDARFELVGEMVLEPLGLLVDLIPGEPERLHEIQLQQPVVTHDLECHPLARWGEGGAVVALVHDQAEGRELLQHGRRRGRRHLQRLGQSGGGHLTRPLQLPNCF